MNETSNTRDENKQEIVETVVQIKRTSKKTKGGNRLGFTCLAVVGDRNGKVGSALSHAPSVLPAVKKSMRRARKEMITFPIVGEARTIPHEIELARGANRILLKPAPAGTGIRAGGAVRAVLEAAGLQNVVAKILGSNSKKGNVDTTLEALTMLKSEASRRISKNKGKDKK
ncbi:30S ribosomal protein S5 [candidate division WWE3 bacterium]|nr:30S ribosomal protein S5 [candidate division WWE3 bacterium]